MFVLQPSGESVETTVTATGQKYVTNIPRAIEHVRVCSEMALYQQQ